MSESIMGSSEPGCESACGLPEIRVSERHRLLQAAAFALLLEHDQPAATEQIAARAGISESEAAELLVDFDTVGRVRFSDHGRVVGIAGLSIEPTRHRIGIGGTTRWTWCALDAIGILGALGREATFTTVVPDSDQEVIVEFTADGPEETDAVVFIADGYGSDSVVETWCPTVNLFPDADAANAWATRHGVSGFPTPVPDLADDAAAMWTPVTDPT